MPAAKNKAEVKPVLIPEKFKHQLGQLVQSFEHLQVAVKRGDIDAVRREFSRLGQRVRDVDSSSLSGHPLMQWNEFAMLLGNDAVEGSSAKSMEAAKGIADTLQGHVKRLRHTFQLQGHGG